ncbi:uncharacterized protein LOC119574894 [Penaeus monodon]|uniref:uncharacterized protein LOC119574894 n=1 Tax=Penaeus monodon TaxID=6687 RepID=UPI0018A72557|nr:uncharacterized protein LOC119574894 [Penaeus monodon]
MPWLTVLVVLVASALPRPVLAGERSVGYVLGGGMGNMLLAKDTRLSASQTLLGDIDGSSVCICRTYCILKVGCKGVSATPVDDHFLCRMVGKTVDRNVFVNSPGATFIFWEST